MHACIRHENRRETALPEKQSSNLKKKGGVFSMYIIYWTENNLMQYNKNVTIQNIQVHPNTHESMRDKLLYK